MSKLITSLKNSYYSHFALIFLSSGALCWIQCNNDSTPFPTCYSILNVIAESVLVTILHTVSITLAILLVGLSIKGVHLQSIKVRILIPLTIHYLCKINANLLYCPDTDT